MKSWMVAAVLVMLSACGCAAPASGPAVSFLVSSSGATVSARPGATVAVPGWSPEVTVHFARPVVPAEIQVSVTGDRWQVQREPDRSDSHSFGFRLRCDLAGCPPVVVTVTAPDLAPSALTLSAATPPLTEQDRADLSALARQIWAMAGRADEAGLLAMLAPESQLTMPGGEFMAEGEAPGLVGVLGWAVERSRAAIRSVTVQERRPYAYMDAVILHTARGDFAIYVTIPDRKLVKIFGAAIFDAP